MSFRLELAKGHSREGCGIQTRKTYLLHRAPNHHCPGFVIPASLTLAATLLSPCYRHKELELGLLALLLETPAQPKAVKARALTRLAPGLGHCKQTS